VCVCVCVCVCASAYVVHEQIHVYPAVQTHFVFASVTFVFSNARDALQVVSPVFSVPTHTSGLGKTDGDRPVTEAAGRSQAPVQAS